MKIIYNSDGSERYVKDEEVEILNLNSSDFISMKNIVGGVEMFYKDNRNIVMKDAYTPDGITLIIGQ